MMSTISGTTVKRASEGVTPITTRLVEQVEKHVVPIAPFDFDAYVNNTPPLEVLEIPSPGSGIESRVLPESERSKNQGWFAGARGFFGRLFGKKEATPSVATTPKPFVAEEIPDPWAEPLTAEGGVSSASSAPKQPVVSEGTEADPLDGIVGNPDGTFSLGESARNTGTSQASSAEVSLDPSGEPIIPGLESYFEPETQPSSRPSTTPLQNTTSRPQGFFKGLWQKTGLFLAGGVATLGLQHLLPAKNIAPVVDHVGAETEQLLVKTFDARIQRAEQAVKKSTFKGAVQVPLKTGGSVVVPLVNHTPKEVKVRLGQITLPDGKVIKVTPNADGKSVTVGGKTYQIK
jgi:hypothetical protein